MSSSPRWCNWVTCSRVTMDNLQSLTYFAPEWGLIATVVVVLLVDLIRNRRDDRQVGTWFVAGLIVTALLLLGNTPDHTLSLFRDAVAWDPFSHFFKEIVLLSSLFVAVVVLNSRELDGYPLGEFYMLLGIMILGMFWMVTSIDLLMAYLAIEIVSLTSFVLAGYLKRSRRSNESALKYVIYGAFSSGLMLFGFSYLFGLTGTTKFHAVAAALRNLDPSAYGAVVVASILILAGFGYKISAVPFHFWTPDVYEGAPTAVTAYLSVAPKAAGFALIIRFFHDVLAVPTGEGLAWSSIGNLPWPQLLAILSVVTMTLGNLVALRQTSVKRMLAYSSIAHAGYMLMALPVLSQDGVFAILLYLVMYLLMNLGAFFVVIVVENRIASEQFEDYRGLGWKMPYLGVLMTLFMFSLTGLPPTAGFIGKFYLFAAVIKAGSAYYWLALVGVINSVISLYYYLRVVKMMYLKGDPQETLEGAGRFYRSVLTLLALPTLLLGLYWAPVAEWVRQSLLLFKP
ncbi:MAG: NADH-quinone oxidoreductase subunit N [Candidatus Neomarinimicrobiota bacterium]|nr:MAG: NADH-quinone oxidoreductase subunit N [Candidatus Neomarinimicrobiota bacterium]